MENALSNIKAWLTKHPGIFACEEEGSELVLMEIATARFLTLNENNIAALEEKKNSELIGQTYMVILFEQGSQLVLSQQGFAFAPDFSNTGPIPVPSQVFCLQDIYHFLNNLQVVMEDENRRKEALEITMLLIALLDGARQVGLDMGKEEQQVDTMLKKIEAG
tara:strand:+ start:91 stop:579 length:489 start_codon:yes stop_codon:yes gene_type:complete